MILGPIPNRWAVRKSEELRFLSNNNDGCSKSAKRPLRTSRRNFFLQSLLGIALGWIDLLLFSVVGNPDLAQQPGNLSASNIFLQTSDVPANLIIVVLCLSGQFLRFVIQMRIFKRNTCRLGATFYGLLIFFSSSLVLLYWRFQYVPWPDYDEVYVGSPFEAGLIWVLSSILFFFGLDSTRRIKYNTEQGNRNQ